MSQVIPNTWPWPEWRVQRVLGKGSYGTVFHATKHEHNVPDEAAIKVISIPQSQAELETLRNDGLNEDSARAFFQQVADGFVEEIRVMQRFKGIQNIVSVEDYRVVEKPNEIGWDIYIRMELLMPFQEYIRTNGINEQMVMKLGKDMCTALELCEREHIIHRDIKPENIFVNRFGNFKLGDFGIARRLDNATGGMSQKGTLNYMAPEVAAGPNYDGRADIYSLGIVLYKLLNGNRLPFLDTEQQAASPMERKRALERRLRGEPLPLPACSRGELAQLVLCACQFDPGRRFTTASAMKDALVKLERSGTRQVRPPDDPQALSQRNHTPEKPKENTAMDVINRVLVVLAACLILMAGGLALYGFKSDTVNSLEPVVLSPTAVRILADTRNGSEMEVICTNATGEIARHPYTAEGVTFTDLSPDTVYNFTLASSEGKILLGSKTVKVKTNQMTQLGSFMVSSISSVSATLALGGTGPQPEKWVVTVTSDSGESIVVESENYEILVEGLTPETDYTATIAMSDGNALGGITTCTFTTKGYTTLSCFEASDVDAGCVTVGWDYSGTVPDSWTVTCDGTDGTSISQEVSGNSCVLDGLASGESYTLKLSCPSLKETELSTIVVAVPAVNITNMFTTATSGNEIVVSWGFEGNVMPANWKVSYAYIMTSGVTSTPEVVYSEEASITLTDLIPNTNYAIRVVGADDLCVGGAAETTCKTGSASRFTDYGCSDAELTLYVLEDNPDGLENSTTEFTPSEHIAFAVDVSYDETEEEKRASAAYVVRDSSGILVRVYKSDTDRHWDGAWITARHIGDLPDCIAMPGSYTLEIYFNGKLLAAKGFTVNG